ncbi:unnamed protein product [Blepharisma stoltei]|uniref:Protein kinase domain-containing protein n=1 Tax=Blepharisma stoltei TaxID=1481888 RepID=A0AAU9ILV2_9CILI|nr:unnamed protein product [Blepharisma stoltei]
MVSEDDDCNFKLADFGLATEVNGALTLRCGSPGYTAPEILRKCSYGLKVDVFSTGVILYILLCGRMPFWGKTNQEILQKNRDCKISFKHEPKRNISKFACAFILRLTEPLPKLRPSARDALKDPWFESLSSPTLSQQS